MSRVSSLLQRLRPLAGRQTAAPGLLHGNPTRQRIALFISIPRTGSQSVQAILGLGPNRDQEDTTSLVIHENHQRAAILTRKYDLASLFVFCFVRNPFDRCVSWYEYHRRWEPYRSLSFSAWVEAGLPHHFRIQNETDYVASGLTPLLQTTFIDGCEPDFIGRFESFADDMATIVDRLNEACARRGLDHRFQRSHVHVNRSRRRGNLQEYYTPRTRAAVARLLRDDFERLAYPTS